MREPAENRRSAPGTYWINPELDIYTAGIIFNHLETRYQAKRRARGEK